MFDWLKKLFSKKDEIKDKIVDVKEKAEEAVDTFKDIVEDAKEIAKVLGCKIEEIKDKVKELKETFDNLGDISLIKKLINNKDKIAELVKLVNECRIEVINNTERVNLADFKKIRDLIKSIFE